MSLHYILDGYNIIYKVSAFQKSSGQKSRDTLINYIKTRKPQGSPKNKVTLVFDGAIDVIEYPQNSYPVEVIFSREMSADEYILRLIKKSPNPKVIIVVSDDREIERKALLLDAKVMRVKDFFKLNKRDSQDSGLTVQELQEIKDELMKREEQK
jgi:predicted RNA-binding protein with PIN domain